MVMHFHRRGKLNGTTLNVVGRARNADDDTAAEPPKRYQVRPNRPVDPETRRELARERWRRWKAKQKNKKKEA